MTIFDALFDKLDASMAETFDVPEQPQLRDLAMIIADHSLWLADRNEGRRAVLGRTNWNGIDMHGMNLNQADLSRASLINAYLPGIELTNADLYFADLYNANLQDANLHGADMRCTRLTLANLQDADLSGAHLCETDLRSADLRGADLRNTTTAEADFRTAKLDDVTMNWKSGELIGERLYQAADTIDEYMIACFICRRPKFAWWELDNLGWAVQTMKTWIKHHDDIPDYLRKLFTERA